MGANNDKVCSSPVSFAGSVPASLTTPEPFAYPKPMTWGGDCTTICTNSPGANPAEETDRLWPGFNNTASVNGVPLTTGDVGLGATLEDDRSDDQTGLTMQT